MKSVHIRDVEPRTLAALKRLAKSHQRSLQGELRSILTLAARMAPVENALEHLDLVTVQTGKITAWDRDEIYGDESR